MTEFEQECRARVDQLRTAFAELYDDIGADPGSPQQVSRTLRLNKTLAWNVARLLQAADSLRAVTHVPGAASLEKVIQAGAKHGANAEVLAKARTAVQDFHRMISAHAGDRPTLDLILDGAKSSESPLELSRKLAFRGNSGLYGVQARTQVQCNFIAPNPENPSRLDMVTVRGFVGLRRLRPNVRWPLFMVRAWSGRDEQIVSNGWEPLEVSEAATNGFPLLPSFSGGNAPPIHSVDTPEGRDFVLAEGPVGNDGAFDCFCGDMMRGAVELYAAQEGDIGEFGAAITTPVERLVSDIIVDQSLGFALKPQTLVFGRIFPHGQRSGTTDDPTLLPISQPAAELTGSPPMVNTPLVPRYAQLVRQVFQRMNWQPERFRGTRLLMEYPPLGSNVILRFPLPARPVT
jgi:hypothetical protein